MKINFKIIHLALEAIYYKHESFEIINPLKLANKNNVSLNSFALSTESVAL